MAINKAVTLGLTGNELSKKITGTSEVNGGRTAVATATGAVLGAAADGAIIFFGASSAPIVVPLAVGSAVVAGIASLFD